MSDTSQRTSFSHATSLGLDYEQSRAHQGIWAMTEADLTAEARRRLWNGTENANGWGMTLRRHQSSKRHSLTSAPHPTITIGPRYRWQTLHIPSSEWDQSSLLCFSFPVIDASRAVERPTFPPALVLAVGVHAARSENGVNLPRAGWLLGESKMKTAKEEQKGEGPQDRKASCCPEHIGHGLTHRQSEEERKNISNPGKKRYTPMTMVKLCNDAINQMLQTPPVSLDHHHAISLVLPVSGSEPILNLNRTRTGPKLGFGETGWTAPNPRSSSGFGFFRIWPNLIGPMGKMSEFLH
ncbi:hypothetical protein C8R44DRAFT_738234 [Mycena epipterygia]|nr:hypothetical protein C8R44DRAFT_738234 [Mycena epipterygia]